MPYHISNKGMLTPCKAKPGKCPLGGRHFQDEQQGMEYLDNQNQKENLIENYKSATTPFQRKKIASEIQSFNYELGLDEYADIPKVETDIYKEIYDELATKHIQDIKKFAEKINTEFVDFKVNNRGEIVINVIDNNKPRNITFYHPIGGNKNVKTAKFGNAHYQCKNPLKKWHQAEQQIELILAGIR